MSKNIKPLNLKALIIHDDGLKDPLPLYELLKIACAEAQKAFKLRERLPLSSVKWVSPSPFGHIVVFQLPLVVNDPSELLEGGKAKTR